MKTLSILTMIFCLSGGTAMAQDSEEFNLLPENYGTETLDPQQFIRCRAYDAGHEEHFRGHPTCEACLHHHDECIRECRYTRITYACTFRRQNNNGTYSYFTGRDEDRWEARQEAREICMASSRNHNRCEFVGCERSRGREFIRRDYCRRY